MPKTVEELNAQASAPLPLWYLTRAQWLLGMRKRPGWYGWRSISGWCISPKRPTAPTYYTYVAGKLLEHTAD